MRDWCLAAAREVDVASEGSARQYSTKYVAAAMRKYASHNRLGVSTTRTGSHPAVSQASNSRTPRGGAYAPVAEPRNATLRRIPTTAAINSTPTVHRPPGNWGLDRVTFYVVVTND